MNQRIRTKMMKLKGDIVVVFKNWRACDRKKSCDRAQVERFLIGGMQMGKG